MYSDAYIDRMADIFLARGLIRYGYTFEQFVANPQRALTLAAKWDEACRRYPLLASITHPERSLNADANHPAPAGRVAGADRLLAGDACVHGLALGELT